MVDSLGRAGALAYAAGPSTSYSAAQDSQDRSTARSESTRVPSMSKRTASISAGLITATYRLHSSDIDRLGTLLIANRRSASPTPQRGRPEDDDRSRSFHPYV